MKSATLFLVAVTAFTSFLECSTTAAALVESITANNPGPYGDTVEIDEDFIQLVYRAIEVSEKTLADSQKAMRGALSTATGEEKDRYEQVEDWIDGWWAVLVAEFPKTLLDAIYSQSRSALKDCQATITENISYIRATLDKFNDILPKGDAKSVLNVSLESLLAWSGKVHAGIQRILAEKALVA